MKEGRTPRTSHSGAEFSRRLLLAGLFCGVTLGAWLPAAAQDQRNPVVTSLTLFAGTPLGLSRSTDWGGTWKRVANRELDGLGAVHAILALGTRVLAGGDGGLALSEDFGQSWKRVTAELPAVTAILTSRYPDADPTIFVGSERGLLKSPDAGRTFNPTPLRTGRVNRLDWPGPALVVATSEGVFKSVDSADKFEPLASGLPAGDVGALVLSSFFAADPVLFAGVGAEGLFHSADGGRTWKPAGLAGQRVSDLIWLGSQLYAVTEQGVRRSEDLGVTWKDLREGLAGAQPRRILFPLAPESALEAFLATSAGIFHTPDAGQHWMPMGLKGEDVLCLATFPPASSPSAGKKKKGR